MGFFKKVGKVVAAPVTLPVKATVGAGKLAGKAVVGTTKLTGKAVVGTSKIAGRMVYKTAYSATVGPMDAATLHAVSSTVNTLKASRKKKKKIKESKAKRHRQSD